MAIAHLPKGAKKARGVGATMIQRSRSKSAEEKAEFHNITGAGRSGVIREFMGLNEDDVDVLTKVVEDGIDRLLAGER